MTEPDHAGFGTACDSCHDTRGWRPARFDHPDSFPLSLGHAGRTCSACHQRGSYAGLSPRCDSCHLDDWQRATNPDHRGFGFPTDCAACHGTAAWRPATFVHEFPISGPHRVSCVECHRDGGNPRLFSCTHCHEHRQSEMDDEHRGVRGYLWSSPACYQCHPRGRK